MIRILGARRILTILILIGVNVVLAATVYLYLMPEGMKKERELKTLRGQTSTVQNDITRMQIEFNQLSVQQAQFDQLRKRGFFGKQGRREAEIVFEKIQKQAGVVSAIANIQGGTVEDNVEAEKAEHKILVSPVKIRLEAMDDVDVYRYLYLVDRFFPGHMAIQRISLERKAEISGDILRSIAGGANPQLVSADIDVLWRTMIPSKDVIGAPVEGAPQ